MYPFIKRLFDLVFSVLALIFLSPLLIPIVIGLKLTGEGYVFYLQKRVGYKNAAFQMFKFATMLKDSPNMPGGIITTKNDPRITPMGGFLRKSKINELPQLFNIVKGDMSFIGPRPVVQKSFNQYPPNVQKVIYNVIPGITGIGSIIFRNEEELITKVKESGKDTWDFYRNHIYPYKGKVEKWYQKHRSFKVDFLILFLTVYVILFSKSKVVYSIFPTLPKPPQELTS